LALYAGCSPFNEICVNECARRRPSTWCLTRIGILPSCIDGFKLIIGPPPGLVIVRTIKKRKRQCRRAPPAGRIIPAETASSHTFPSSPRCALVGFPPRTILDGHRLPRKAASQRLPGLLERIKSWVPPFFFSIPYQSLFPPSTPFSPAWDPTA